MEQLGYSAGNKAMRRLIAILSAVISVASAAERDQLEHLRVDDQRLYALYTKYQSMAPKLQAYTKGQGFTAPYESLATVLHEMVHIDSAVHQGFSIDGVYYEPYVSAQHWPATNNSDVAPTMLSSERGAIHSIYMRHAPKNNLGNVLDEVNAYSHVIGFVCKNEPSTAPKQIANLRGHLNVVEAYLRLLRTSRPGEYRALSINRLSAGALITITSRARAALLACGQLESEVPKVEAEYFSQLPR
jgi:hypothetical protein